MKAIDQPLERERNLMAQKETVTRAWLENAALKPESTAHVLLFDLRDDYARNALLRICNDVEGERYRELKRVLRKPQNRMQSMFAREELFASIGKAWKEDFALKPGYFGVLYFGYGGMSLYWLPIPLASDGQNRRFEVES